MKAQKIDLNDYESKAQGYAILSAQYSNDAYSYARRNYFMAATNTIKSNSDTAIVYAEIAMEYADSAIIFAHDTNIYAKEVMLYAKEYQQEAIDRFKELLGSSDPNLIHDLAGESMYAMGNAVTDAYEASLYFGKIKNLREDDDTNSVDGDGKGALADGDGDGDGDGSGKGNGNGEEELGDDDFEIPEGVVYRIQIGLFKKVLPESHFDDVFPIKTQISVFKGPAESEKIKGDYYRHVAGSFPRYKDAKLAQKMIHDKGYKDAFVIGYLDGKKVSIDRALKDEGYKVQREDLDLVQGNNNRNISRLESDEFSYETVNDLYSQRLVQIDEQIASLKAEDDDTDINNYQDLVEVKFIDDKGNTIAKSKGDKAGKFSFDELSQEERDLLIEAKKNETLKMVISDKNGEELALTKKILNGEIHKYVTLDMETSTIQLIPEIDEEMLSMEQIEAKKAIEKRAANRNNLIILLEQEKEEIIAKRKDGENKLTDVRKDLEAQNEEQGKELLFTDDGGGSFYDEDVPYPINPELPKGLIYKVQVGFYQKKLPAEHFDGISIVAENTNQISYKYLAGSFTRYEDAKAAKNSILEKGYSDAFVIAYFDGRKVSIEEALDLEKEK